MTSTWVDTRGLSSSLLVRQKADGCLWIGPNGCSVPAPDPTLLAHAADWSELVEGALSHGSTEAGPSLSLQCKQCLWGALGTRPRF